MQVVIDYIKSPQGMAVVSSVGFFILSELKGWGKGGSLFQSLVVDNGLKLTARFASDAAKAVTADVLKIEGKDPSAIIPPTQG